MIRRNLDRNAKYGNTPNRCAEGYMHQSKLEAKRCNELHALQRGSLIRQLEAHPQPVYRLEVNGRLVTTYRPDFRYVEADGGRLVVEDVKGVATAVYRMKKKLMLACHGIEVEEVRR